MVSHPLPRRSYGVDVPATSFHLHEWDIHIVCRGTDDASGAGGTAAADEPPGQAAGYDATADRFLEDFAADLPAGSWDEQLAAAGWRLRQVLLSHRDGARVIAGTYVAEPNTILLGNMVIEILQAAGLPPEQAGWAAFAAFHYVLGHTIEEQAQIEQAERFGYGLQLFLDGIRQQTGAASVRLPGAAKGANLAGKGTHTPRSPDRGVCRTGALMRRQLKTARRARRTRRTGRSMDLAVLDWA